VITTATNKKKEFTLYNSLSFSFVHIHEEVLFDKIGSVFIDNDGIVVVVSADGVSIFIFIGSR
jgi:hypothetical protein